MKDGSPSWRCGMLFLLGVIALLPLLSACTSAPPPYRPPDYRTPPPPPPSPPPDRCTVDFDPCSCDLWKFKIPLLDERLEAPGDTTTQREETAANLRKTANDFKNEYWTTGRLETGVFALRFYDGYLRLVPLSNRFAPFALLHSTAIYCDLGCRMRANELAEELRVTYRHDPVQIAKALAGCG